MYCVGVSGMPAGIWTQLTLSTKRSVDKNMANKNGKHAKPILKGSKLPTILLPSL
jgi:hypothetical protein